MQRKSVREIRRYNYEDSGASNHVVVKEKPLVNPTETLKRLLRIQTANGDITISKKGMLRGVGTTYLHDEQQSQHESQSQDMKVSINETSPAIVARHADESISEFKLEDGLCRTTLCN